MRKTLLAANWKMNKTAAEAISWLNDFYGMAAEKAAEKDLVEVAVCAPFTALYALYQERQRLGAVMGLGAQNIFWQEKGAFTGEICRSFRPNM